MLSHTFFIITDNSSTYLFFIPYQRIIGMGQPVVPLIFRDLEQKSDYWFWALRAITSRGDNKSQKPRLWQIYLT
ncbi:hypothetical protein [Microcoleus sp. SVA1_A1]|uniref:hypothetical protein n=1 Tax=Microcoleus sp. SVA1_A1 TaxID=2818946 RepID=UPI002FCFD14B